MEDVVDGVAPTHQPPPAQQPPAPPAFVALPQQTIADYVNILKSRLPTKTKLRLTWRQRAGNLVPAGDIAQWTGEVHSWGPVDDVTNPRETLWLFFPEVQDNDGAETLVELPNPDCEYSAVEILPTPSKMPVGRTVPREQPPKRARDYDDIADALRGEAKKVPLCNGLKIPQEIPQRFEVFYPHLFLDKQAVSAVDRWRACFTEFVLAHKIELSLPQKRAEFWGQRDAYIAWLATAQPLNTMSTKQQWLLPFSMTFKLLSLSALAIGGFSEEAKVSAAAMKAFDDGYVNFSTLWSAVQTEPAKNRQGRGRRRFQPQQQDQAGGATAPPPYKPQSFRPRPGRN